ncbi:MAG: transcriptional activator RfaH [Magnetospirillum sp.]
MNWVAVWTHPNGEFKAEQHLLAQGFDVYLPRYQRQRRHARRVQTVIRPFFPRYLFCRPTKDSHGLRSIISTRGVARLVGHGESPDWVSDQVIDALRAREDENGLMSPTTGLNAGQKVTLAGHPNLDLVFECADDGERAILLLDFLGTQTRVRVPLDRLAAI